MPSPEELIGTLIRELKLTRESNDALRAEVTRLTGEIAKVQAGGAPPAPKTTAHKVGEALGPHAAELLANWLRGPSGPEGR